MAFHPTLVVLVGGISLLAGVAAARSAHTQVPPAKRSVNDGVYLAEQADRGEDIYNAKCRSCHPADRWVGDPFLGTWVGRPLADLFESLRTTMPEDNPGALPSPEYADLIAYLLELNGFPAGSEELKGTEEAMKAITMERKRR